MKLFVKLFFLFYISSIFTTYAQQSFPESWIGNYMGHLMIYDVDSVKMKIDMELKISKTKNDSIYKWVLIYDLNGEKDIREYELVIADKQKGHYKIDEKNSIIIDSYLRNGSVLTSFFKVSNSFILATYTKLKDNLVFEIISIKSDSVNITGNTKNEEEEIPEVYSYLVNARQKAILIKMKNLN